MRRLLLALRIAFLEARIEHRRDAFATLCRLLDEDRRKVNLAHQELAALDGHRQKPYQFRRGS